MAGRTRSGLRLVHLALASETGGAVRRCDGGRPSMAPAPAGHVEAHQAAPARAVATGDATSRPFSAQKSARGIERGSSNRLPRSAQHARSSVRTAMIFSPSQRRCPGGSGATRLVAIPGGACAIPAPGAWRIPPPDRSSG